MSFVTDSFEFLHSQSKHKSIENSFEECCLTPKENIDSKKANLGKDFFRQLTTMSDLQPTINHDNICYLMHFLFQQASINNKPIRFDQGLFF